MSRRKRYAGSILMLSLHGYVAVEPEFGKPDTGGQVVFVLELAKRFSRLGYRVDVVTRKFERQARVERINNSLRIWRIPFGGKKFIRKEDMHDHLGNFVTNLEEMRIPHVHTPHSLGWWKREGMDGDPEELEQVYRLNERIQKEFLTYRSCDHVIATTLEQFDILLEQYDLTEKNITVIPPGVDENRFLPVRSSQRQEIRQRLGVEPNTIYAVGRMATNKGYDLLIQALDTTLKLVPDAALLLAAGGEDSERDREKLAELKGFAGEIGVYDSIKWCQYIADEDMADYYRAASVFALSSRYEPFGMTAIEAMACGTPTVITVHGGLRDLIEFGSQALFADPQLPEEFGVMLSLPLRYPALAEELSNEGSRFARRSFGWTGIAKRTLAVFDQFKGKYLEQDSETFA